MLELWTYLNEKYIKKASDTKDLLSLPNKLELSLKRYVNQQIRRQTIDSYYLLSYYVINCVSRGSIEKLREFFAVCGEELTVNPEWTEWFGMYQQKSFQ